MFFLDHAWLVPLIPALSFVVILFFGKRFPRKGSEIGTLAVGASFVLSCGTLYQWIKRVQDADHSHGVGAAIGALGRSVGRLGAAGSVAQVAARRPPSHLVPEQRRSAHGRHPDRRTGIDRDVRRHPRVVARTRVLDGIHARRPPVHPLLRGPEPVHRFDVAARRGRQHAADCWSAGNSSGCARSC